MSFYFRNSYAFHQNSIDKQYSINQSQKKRTVAILTCQPFKSSGQQFIQNWNNI